jgi:non-haem Fe2+, alpha-ketoglutarate-dependent halogenase
MDKSTAIDPLVESFEKNGFAGPIKLYEPEEAREIIDRIRINNLDRDRILFDNDVNWDRHFDVPELTRHIGHPALVGILRKILGDSVLCWRTETLPKFPGSSGTQWHQVKNFQYATGEPMLQPAVPGGPLLDVTVWTTFTEATRENGCMKFLPGSHKRFYYDESRVSKAGRDAIYEPVRSSTPFYGYDFEDFKIDPEWIPDEEQAVTMEMRAGECVIFSDRCVHGSYPNTTERSTRFAFNGRYVPTNVRVYPGWTEYTAHGGRFDLTDYGCVLVCGEDRYGHNKLRETNNHQERFPHLGVADPAQIEKAAANWGDHVLDRA